MLENYRNQIDAIDTELLRLFLNRMEIVKEIARYKQQQGLPVLQPDREIAVIEARSSQCPAEMQEYTQEFFTQLMRISRQMQQSMLDGE